MQTPPLRRRRLLAGLALPALSGCGTPLPALSGPGIAPEARVLLERCADAHGQDAWPVIHDLSLRYAGEWAGLIGRLQPALVDQGFRGSSEERLLPRERLVAQAHSGPDGRKQVVRRAAPEGSDAAGSGPDALGEVRVWFNGEPARDAERRAAAALVADGYSLFLLGPLLLAPPGRVTRLEAAGTERITLDGGARDCDVLRARIAPGLGFSPTEQLALFIDRDDGLMRRVRFSLDGLPSTRGAVAEVDTFDHLTLHGIRWPTRFHERLLRPLPLPVHDWWLTGLDVNRGLRADELGGAAFAGAALRPATALARPAAAATGSGE